MTLACKDNNLILDNPVVDLSFSEAIVLFLARVGVNILKNISFHKTIASASGF